MKIKNQETVFKSYFQLDKITLTKDDKEIIREVITKKSAVAGIVYNTIIDKYVFVKQFRPGVKDNILEIVAGTLDVTNEDPKDCMIREVEEEVGYKVDNIKMIRKPFYTSPGYSNEQMTLYYCEVSEKISEGGGNIYENEYIEIVEMNYDDMKNYNFIDAKTIIALNFVL